MKRAGEAEAEGSSAVRSSSGPGMAARLDWEPGGEAGPGSLGGRWPGGWSALGVRTAQWDPPHCRAAAVGAQLQQGPRARG